MFGDFTIFCAGFDRSIFGILIFVQPANQQIFKGKGVIQGRFTAPVAVDVEVFQGYFGGKQYKCMVILLDFPDKSALFGLVI